MTRSYDCTLSYLYSKSPVSTICWHNFHCKGYSMDKLLYITIERDSLFKEMGNIKCSTP
jgi:hypothetical protein